MRVFACPRRVRFGILEGVPHISSYNVRCRRCFKNALIPTPELVSAKATAHEKHHAQVGRARREADIEAAS